MKYTELITTLNVYQNFSSDFLAGKLSQAYLFICEDRLTSKVLLEAMGALLVCENQCLCGKCGGCAKSNAGTHPDILIYPKSKSFNVGDAGEIYDKVQVKPMIANRKVFLINDMDLSTEQAQNKMLKIIEEPPQNVVFLISAKNENKILKTIQSRVQKKYVDKLEKNILNSILNCDENIKKMAIFNGDGYLGKTLDIQANEEFLNIYENMKKIIINLKNSGQIPLYLKNLYIF